MSPLHLCSTHITFSLVRIAPVASDLCAHSLGPLTCATPCLGHKSQLNRSCLLPDPAHVLPTLGTRQIRYPIMRLARPTATPNLTRTRPCGCTHLELSWPAATDRPSANRRGWPSPPLPFFLPLLLSLFLFLCFFLSLSSLGSGMTGPPLIGLTPPNAAQAPLRAAARGPGPASQRACGRARTKARASLVTVSREGCPTAFSRPPVTLGRRRLPPFHRRPIREGELVPMGLSQHGRGTARPAAALPPSTLPFSLSSLSLSPSRLPCQGGGERWCVAEETGGGGGGGWDGAKGVSSFNGEGRAVPSPASNVRSKDLPP